MINASSAAGGDPFDLSRFISAQENHPYDAILKELKSGRKRTHWMWYVFPQIEGLGHSETAKYYAIRNREHARRYLDHPVLGKRLLECAEAVFAVEGRSIPEIFGSPDDLKFKSSMTLFASVAVPCSLFHRVLDKFFNGEQDALTCQRLELLKEQ